jgi:iron(III) transport system substrate-binding protein
MIRNISIVLTLALVIALPFAFRRPETTFGWREGDPVLVIVSPHNRAIRAEFAEAFARWHAGHYGRPAKIDWRTVGGTTEIMRYLAAEYVAAFRAWWQERGRDWPDGGGRMILDRRFDCSRMPEDVRGDPARETEWALKRDLHTAFRSNDSPSAFSCKIDLFFGGGTYDHGKAGKQGLTVPPWAAGEAPPETVATADGQTLFPERLGGETWRTETFYGTALSTFGICYNVDRLRDLGVESPPAAWEDLTDPRYFRQLGVADPTKSGSSAKAFEMMIHEQCHKAVRAAGFAAADVARFEKAIGGARLPPGALPDGVPRAYQDAVEQGWRNGLLLVQAIGANARYVTDSSSKVPLDIGVGNAAAGIAIGFYGRFQSEICRAPDGTERMRYVTPVGGSSVSADPISLLRGAEHRELAVRFIRFVLSEDGQKLWNYAAGAPGGPRRFALRRLPVRADFYPSDGPEFHAAYERHREHTVDPLGDPDVNPYVLARRFTYYPRWTARHFSVHRHLIRAMCLDAGVELQAAWEAIHRRGGAAANARAMALLQRLPDTPEPLTWADAMTIGKRHDALDYVCEWTRFFRASYHEAEQAAGGEL